MENTEGSCGNLYLYLVNITHRHKKVNFRLNRRQKSILVGSLLGDANINKRGKCHRALFKHSGRQRHLLAWKRQEFDSITGMSINDFQQVVKGNVYDFSQFVTLTHPEFSAMHTVFYSPKRGKIVPVNIAKLIKDSISLAVWIMDDGAKDNVGMTIQTHSFSKREVERLIRALKLNFNLLCTMRKNRGKFIIYFPKSQIPKLWRLVRAHTLPEYRYKFPLTP